MLQTERPITSNDTGCTADSKLGWDNWIKLGKRISNDIKWDIIDLLLITNPPEDFEYEADIKYLCYKEKKLVGILAYNLVPMGREMVPLCVHIIGEPEFRKTREAYEFMLDTFKDLKKEHKTICTHIPNDRNYIIKPMLKFGFTEYSEDKYGKFYYLDLEKI